MRLSELAQKELVNFNDGQFLGQVGRADLLIDETTGEIKALLLQKRSNLFSFFPEEKFLKIPWASVKKIGRDMVIVEI